MPNRGLHRRAARLALSALACAGLGFMGPAAPQAEQGGAPGASAQAGAVAVGAAVGAVPPDRAVGAVERDIPYRGAAGPRLDVHRPPSGRRRAAAVLVIHGGAWSGGDKRAIGHVARTLASAGFVAINVNYTLSTPARPGFPHQLDELRAAVRWVRRRAASLGVDPTRIGALGSSAGGHLATLLASSSVGPLSRADRVGAVVAWSPPTDLGAIRLRSRLGGKIAGFLGCSVCPRLSATASPIAHVSGDDAPTMIVNSRRELVPVTQARRLAMRLRAEGVPLRLWLLPGTLHAPLYSPTALGPSISFLRKHLR